MHYRWIDYPETIDSALKAKYEALADKILAEATEPIAVVWASEGEDWVDEAGNDPPRNCLLITQHLEIGEGEWSFGLNLATHRLT